MSLDDDDFDYSHHSHSRRNDPVWSEEYRLAGVDWADKEAAAQLLEDTKSALLAQWETELGDIPKNRAEQTVKSSQRWMDQIEKIVEARRLANIAKVNLDVVRMRAWEHSNKEATQRAEMRLSR